MKKNFLKLWEAAALLALCITLCTALWAQGRQAELRENVLRLHVLAVSDEEYEQRLKMQVRDSVLSYVEALLEDSENLVEAEELVLGNLTAIANAAYAAAEGRQVSVRFGEESYPSRSYEGGSLPAGRYKALKVVLGEGEGQNWWGVVFPDLSLSAGRELSECEKIVLEGEDKIFRFKILELWGEFIN